MINLRFNKIEVIKCKKLTENFDFFTKNGKGSFNLSHYENVLKAKGIDPFNKLEIRYSLCRR